MRMRFIYFAGSLLFAGLLFSEFAPSSNAAKAILRPRASANTALQPLPTLRGTAAVERLKEEGLYSSLAEAVAAADPLIVQQAKLTADDGAAGDSFGASVAISGNTAVIGASHTDVNATAQGSVHVFVRSGRIWTRQARLTTRGAAASDHFGASVAISGDILVAGAPNDDIETNMDQGSAHVFVRSGATWSHLQKLTVDDGAADCQFGASAAIDADTIVIGAPGVDGYKGAVYVFALGGETWGERQKLAAPDAAYSDHFGAAVAIDADTIVVGAPYQHIGLNADQGSAYVFTRSGGNWSQTQKLTAQGGAASANFGVSVAIDADTIVVGAPYHRESANSNQGSAHVFARNGASWTHQAQLAATDGARYEAFGCSVAINADTVVIGAWGADRLRGAAYIFARVGANWSRRQRLAAEDGAAGDSFGASVAISRETMIVGTPRAYGTIPHLGSAYAFVISGDLAERQKFTIGTRSAFLLGDSVAISGEMAVVGANITTTDGNSVHGSVFVLARSDSSWRVQEILAAPDGMAYDDFGASVAISGNTIVVGAPGTRVGVGLNHGAAYVFTRNYGSWGTPRKLTADGGRTMDFFGWSVAIYGDTVVIGAYGAGSGQGLAYVFARSGADWIQRQRLTASNGAYSNGFGESVAIDADTLVIGASREDSNRGSVYIFTHTGENWVQRQKLTADDGGAGDWFGYSVAISGETVVVGARRDDSSRGAAYVFTRNAEAFTEPIWTQRQKLTASDGGPSAEFGASVSISGGIIVVGALALTPNPEFAAYVFVRRLGWEQYKKLSTPGRIDLESFVGRSAAVSGDTVIAANWFTPSPWFYIEPEWRYNTVYVFTCGGCPNIELDPVTLPEAVVGGPYSQAITANDGAAPYQFSLSSGSLPPGMTLSPDGLFSGYPLIGGAYSFTITATASNLCLGRRDYTLIVGVPCPAIAIKTDLPAGAVGQPYSQIAMATGGTAPYSFKISAGSAPPGLTLSPKGEINGVPTNAGAFNFTVTASDANGCAGSRDYTLTINK